MARHGQGTNEEPVKPGTLSKDKVKQLHGCRDKYFANKSDCEKAFPGDATDKPLREKCIENALQRFRECVDKVQD